jgi:putative ABC transport system permease protein
VQALRTLLKHPAFAGAGALTVALAVAGNTAIFAVVKALVLDPLPYRDAQQLITLDVRSTRGFLISTSIPNYRDWNQSRVFASYGAAAGWGMTLTGRGDAQVLNLRAVLGDFFRTLGASVYRGRLITAAETEPGAEGTIVLGYGFWQRRLGGDPAVVGQTLLLDQRPYVVVGILSPGFGYPSAAVDGYIPMGSIPGLPWDDRQSGFGTRVVARLAPGVTPELAQQALDRVTSNVEAQVGRPIDHPELRTLTDFYVHDLRRQAWVVMAAVGCLLLIAVANVGSLALVRGEDRRRELALRAALGARRSELFRLLLEESLILSIIGGVVGTALAFAAVHVMVPLLPSAIPQVLRDRIGVDAGVLLFTLVITTIAGLLFGVFPAISTSDLEPSTELRESARGSSAGQQRLRASLVVAEVALSLILLIGAGLMLESLANLRHSDKGFDDRSVLTARIGLPQERYSTKTQWLRFFDDLLPRISALPGVRSAALSLLVPLSDRSWEMGILPDNVPYDRTKQQSVLLNIVSVDYFKAMGVPLLEGRTFTEADRDGAPLVAIIDETMAAKFWPGEDPIGRRVSWETTGMSNRLDATPVWRTVVGVVKNVRHYQLANPSRIQVYVPLQQTLQRWGMSLYAILKTDVPPTSLVPPLRRQVVAQDRDVPLTAVQPLADYVDGDLAGSRAVGVLLTTFGAVALVLAGVGIFGLVSYAVSRRSREIGIRMALGADAADVLRWVGRLSFGLTSVGALLGLLAAAGLTRLIRSLLYDVRPLDPGLYGALALLLLLVAALAAYLPARRATHIDPATVLKQEG